MYKTEQICQSKLPNKCFYHHFLLNCIKDVDTLKKKPLYVTESQKD